MAVNYGNLLATAKRLIQENGVAAILSRVDSAGYDPISDTDIGVPQAWATYVVLNPVDMGKLSPDLLAVATSLVNTSISFGLISDLPVGITPQLGDILTVAGTDLGSGDWIVKGCTPTQPNAVGILHTTLLSRGASR